METINRNASGQAPKGNKLPEDSRTEYDSIYRGLIDGMKDTVWLIDFDGNLIDVNKSATVELGYSKEELLSIGLSGIDTSLKKEQIEALAHAMPGDEIQIFKTTHKARDGKIIPVEVCSSIVQFKGRKVILSIARNISQRLEQEEALNASDRQYRNLVERMPDGVYKSTHDGKFIEVNPAMVKMMGYASKNELMTVDIKSQLYFDPGDRESLSLAERSQELGIYRMKKKDGSEIWVEDHGWYISDKDGNTLFHEGILRDVTERKFAEDLLRASEERYRVFLNATGDMVFLKDENLHYQFVNQSLADFFGKGLSAIQGASDFELMAEGAAIHCRESDLEALASDSLVITEEVIGDKIYETHKFKVPLSNSKVGLGGYIREVTERKKAELQLFNQAEELRNLNATKDKFFSIIAHDLKGPFNAILGFTDLLLENYQNLDGEAVGKSLQAISSASRQAYALLENLLLWSRSQMGQVPFEPEIINLQEKIAQNVLLSEIQAQNKQIRVTVNVPGNIMVQADRNMMDTIIRNLLSNAIKFTPMGGSVMIDATQEESAVIVTVKDTGVGIPPENLQNIFRIENKISTRGTEKERGSGLGLILCREFIVKHQGTIWVESAVGKGSVFRFTIPSLPVGSR